MTRVEGELAKELEQRGTAEVSDGVVNQVTQAIDETESEVKYLIFGVLKSEVIIPTTEACAKCSFWEGKFEGTKRCQDTQVLDAQARGFNKLVYPRQLIGGG